MVTVKVGHHDSLNFQSMSWIIYLCASNNIIQNQR